jgi:trehalose-6-phosphate synthase
MDGAIVEALSMTPFERKRRMKSLRAAVLADDISHWRPGTLPITAKRGNPAVA